MGIHKDWYLFYSQFTHNTLSPLKAQLNKTMWVIFEYAEGVGLPVVQETKGHFTRQSVLHDRHSETRQAKCQIQQNSIWAY